MKQGERMSNVLILLWILVFLLLVFLTSGCGKGVDVSPRAEKWEVAPGETIRLEANLENMYPGTYVAKRYWTILDANCGDLSCATCASTYWKAPDIAPQTCSISAEVILRDRAHPYYEESVTTYFDIKVVAVVTVNKSPEITTFHIPLQFVSPDETISLWVEAYDPEGGPLTYHWTASCGRIDGGGSGISWTAPSKIPTGGKCVVRVSVEDQEIAAVGTSAEFVVK